MGNNRSMQKRNAQDNRALSSQVKVNHYITEAMVQSNRTLGPKEAKDLRSKISQSAADNGLYKTASNESRKDKTNNSLVREGLDTRYIEEARTTKNYGGVKPMKNTNKHRDLDYELYKNTSTNTLLRSQGAIRAKHKTVNDNIDDIDMPEFSDAPTKRARDPKKYKGRGIQSDHGDIAVGESTGDIDIHETLAGMIDM
jgi:hypothetical protein